MSLVRYEFSKISSENMQISLWKFVCIFLLETAEESLPLTSKLLSEMSAKLLNKPGSLKRVFFSTLHSKRWILNGGVFRYLDTLFFFFIVADIYSG